MDQPRAEQVELESREVVVVRDGLARKMQRIGLGVLLASPLALDSAKLTGGHLAPAALSVFLGGVLVALALFVGAAAARRIGSKKPAKVRVAEGRLTIDRAGAETRIPAGDLEEGRHLPMTGHVELRRRSGDLVRIAAGDKAIPLLEAAGADASRRTVRLKLGETTFLTWLAVLLGPSLVWPLASLAVSVVPFATAGVAVFAALWYLLLRVVYAAWGPEEVVLGADGVRIQRAFSSVFVPFFELHKVTSSADSVWLSLRDGSLVRARARYLTTEQRDIIYRHVSEAQRRAGADVPAHALTALDRGGQSVAAWSRALARLAAPQGEYRRAPITPDDLEGVLANPTATPERRLGAAIALSSSRDPEVRKRVRIAADASASEPMRIALRAVADGEGQIEEAAIEEALSSLSAQSR